jgi:hypothetical protein
MPVHAIYKNGKKWAFQWGHHGKKYLVSEYGVKGAQKKAAKQGEAAHANGWRGK